MRIAPDFGGIHLEDISAPECFEIEAALIERLRQAGHARRRARHRRGHARRPRSSPAGTPACGSRTPSVGQLGLGAAGFGIAALMRDAGVQRVLASDPNPASHERARERGDRDRRPGDRDARGRRRRRDHRPPGPDHAGDGAPRPGHPGADEPGAGDRARRRARGGRRVRRRRHVGQQRARLPGHLPRRARRRRALDHERDEARRRAGDRRARPSASELVPDVLDRASTSTSPRPCARPQPRYRLRRGWTHPAWRGAS